MASDGGGKWIGYGLNDTGKQVVLIQHRLLKAYPKNSKAVELGVTESGVYDAATVQAVKNVQPFLKPPQPATGIANYATQAALGAATPPSPPPPAYRKIWFYSAPGSGAAWWVGPAFDVGEWCKNVLHINHQPINFPIGGYMGLMGGDPGLSYNDVIAAEGASLEYNLANNPDIDDPDLELWLGAYSQSADGMKCAVNRLFGDGHGPGTNNDGVPGRFSALRSRINGLILFGDPTRQPGQTKVGNSPPGWGIARKVFPQWLNDLTWSITAEGPGAPDFYAACDDEIRPLFYAEIVQAETSLPFIAHVLKIALPVVSGIPLIGTFLAPILALAAPIMGLVAGPDEPVDAKIEQLLSLQGILTNLPALFKLLGALPGIQSHGSYYDPHPEFGGRTGIQVACDAVAGFRR